MTDLELVCCLGYTGRYKQTIVHHPTQKNTLIYAIGGFIVITDTTDPHNQHLLKNGHDNDVTYVTVSPSGKLIASCQLASSSVDKGKIAVVCVWDFHKKKLIYQLRAHKTEISGLSFSHDDAFLATIGEKRMYLWDLNENGEYAGGLSLRGTGRFVYFVPPKKDFNPNRPRYTLIYADNKVGKCNWIYEIKRMMTFKLEHEDFKLPGRMSGLKRTYTTLSFDIDGKNCFVGTRLGEIMIFSIENNSFSTSVLACSNGVYSIVNSKEFPNVIFAGGGDGTVKIISLQHNNWRIVKEMKVSNKGKVTSLTEDVIGDKIYAGVDDGKILSLDSNINKVLRVLSEAHIGEVNSIQFDPKCEVFCTTSTDGYINEWDLSNYGLVGCYKGVGKPTCAEYASPFEIISGWTDGFIRLIDTKSGKIKWTIINAHKGKVSAIAYSEFFICSGGSDGVIRIWKSKTRELIGQFSEHQKEISGLIIDNEQNHILHSCSYDKCVYSFNLKTNRRICYHTPSKFCLNSISQKITGEKEVLTCSKNGRVDFWDIDYQSPVDGFQIKGNIHFNAIDVSKKTGRYCAFGGDDGTIRIYDISLKKIVITNFGHSSKILSIKWSPDEKQLISTGDDSSICIWNFYSV